MAANARLVLGCLASGMIGAALGALATHLLAPPAPPSAAGPTTAERDALRHELDAARRECADAVSRLGTVSKERDELRARLAAPPATAPRPAPSERPPAPPADPAADRRAQAYRLCNAWAEDALQLRDEAKRNAALTAIRDALASGDPTRVLAGLLAVLRTSAIPQDRDSLRALVLAQFASDDAELRAAAASAAPSTYDRLAPEALAVLLRLRDDPSPVVRLALARAVSWATAGDLVGEASAVYLRAIEDVDAGAGERSGGKGKSRLVSQLGGNSFLRRVSPEIRDRILAEGAKPGQQHDVMHFFLQNIEKTAPVVDFLIGTAETGGADGDLAFHCLGREVPADQAPRVAAFFAKALESGPSNARQYCVQGLRNFGTEAELPTLERIAGSTGLSDAARREIEDVVRAIRARAGR